MNFFKAFFASCLGTVAALVILIMVCIGMIAVLSNDGEVAIAEGSVLHLRLEAPITELEVEDPLSEIFPGTGDQSLGLLQLKQTIGYAKTDPKIKGIFLNTSYVVTGHATLQELRDALIDFKKSGKWVIAYADFYSEGAYYLASAADKIYMYPEGDLEFNGLTADVTFFKKLFDKLEIHKKVHYKPKANNNGWSTAADVLDNLLPEPLPAAISEYRTLRKLQSTYILALPEMISPITNRIHSHFNQFIAQTGRLSSDKPSRHRR